MDIFTQETKEQEWTIYNHENKKDESHKQNTEQNKSVTKDFTVHDSIDIKFNPESYLHVRSLCGNLLIRWRNRWKGPGVSLSPPGGRS